MVYFLAPVCGAAHACLGPGLSMILGMTTAWNKKNELQRVNFIFTAVALLRNSCHWANGTDLSE